MNKKFNLKPHINSHSVESKKLVFSYGNEGYEHFV